MSESASKTPAVPKLRTCRLQLPAPRSSTGTSAAATWRFGNAPVGPRAADREPAAAGERVRPGRCRGRRMSVGPANTDARGRPARTVSPSALDRDRAGQRQDHHLGVAGGELARSAPSASSTHLQARTRPSRPTRGDVDGERQPSRLPAPGCRACCARAHRHHRHGGVDRGRDVAVGRVEQGATDDEPAHRRAARAPSPRRRTSRRDRLGVTAEQQRRQRGRVHDPVHLVDDGQLQPRVAPTSSPRPWPMWIDLITASGRAGR